MVNASAPQDRRPHRVLAAVCAGLVLAWGLLAAGSAALVGLLAVAGVAAVIATGGPARRLVGLLLSPWNFVAFNEDFGHFMLRLLRGGDDVTGATLSRFYGIHVAVLPAITTALVALHLLFVQRQGMSVPLGVERKLGPGKKLPQMLFFPNYILRDVLAWYVVIAVLAALAAFYPWELGNKADPFAVVPAGIRPEWYFLAMFHTLKLVPSHVLGFEGERLGVMAFSVAALFLVLVPFLDRRASRGESSRLFTVIATLVLVYLVVFTIVGHYAK